MRIPEEVESSLIELGINVLDYKNYRETQLAELIPILRSMPLPASGRTGIAA
ncbi:MAG: hypothetical protein OK457_05950 [Thaumarchaeota archaeon]|nr:hypothetical protein [Nitrososphaerota archaeon]